MRDFPLYFSLDLMRPHHGLLALLFFTFAATGHAAKNSFWSRQTVGTLRLDLVGDPAKDERLIFTPDGFVGVTRVTKRRVPGGEESITTQPLFHWRFVGDRVVIYDAASPRDPDETLTFVRREGSFLVLRCKSGEVARFRMTPKV